MNATGVVEPDVAQYLAAVRERLADLPPDERDDLLSEVEASLVETAHESDRPISARLGPPDEFAAELRSAAGLHATAASTDRASRFRQTVRDARARAAGDPRLRNLASVLSELAPIWWLVRAMVAVGLVALLAGDEWTNRLLPPFQDNQSGIAVLLLAILLSVALGLKMRRRKASHPNYVLVAANVLLLVAVLPVGAEALARAKSRVRVQIQTVSQETPGLAFNGVPVANVYPYSRAGRLLHDVLLYDSAGRPLEIRPGAADPNRRVPVTERGDRLFNAFPIRYFEPGTKVVARPYASPSVSLSRIVTAPLERPSRRARSQP